MDINKYLLNMNTQTYSSYYNGRMSYTLFGKEWEKYVSQNFTNLGFQRTSENIFKTVIDMYAENLMPSDPGLSGFSDSLIPLLTRGEAPVLIDRAGVAYFPEHFEMISDGRYTAAAIFTRSLKDGKDYITYAYSDGRTELYAKDIPSDLSEPNREGFEMVEETTGNTLIRFALNDRGFGASLAALQDRINHSIVDQTIIAEMYARPFWYLLNTEIPVTNPYLPSSAQPNVNAMNETRLKHSSGRVFTTSSMGPFGQLEPPTIADMIQYHDSIIDKVSQTTGIPQHYFKPGQATPPTGVALKVLNKRFMAKVAQMRKTLEKPMIELAKALGLEADPAKLWVTDNDLLQESVDAHGLALTQMGYPFRYVSEVVTPEVQIDDYVDDGITADQTDSQTNPSIDLTGLVD